MARSISQTIKLEGAEEIQRLLAGIGQSGKAALGEVHAAAAQASARLESVSKAVASVERSFASVSSAAGKFGGSVQNLGKSFGKFETALSSTIARTGLLVGAITAATLGLAKFITNGIKAADDIDEQAQALGLSAQRYQELGFAAAESGVKAGTFASAIKKFSQEVQEESANSAKAVVKFLDGAARSFDDWGGRLKLVGNQGGNTFKAISDGAAKLQADLAAQGINRPLFLIREQLEKLALGSAEARQEFERLTGIKLPSSVDGLDKLRDQAEGTKNAIRRLGIELKKAGDGQFDISDALSQLADKFKDLPDGAEKTALAMSVFGRAAGPAMIPFLNQGREGIDGLLAKARELGLFLSTEQIAASGKAARAFDILARAATTAKTSFAAAFAPLTTAIATGLTDFLSRNKAAVDAFAESINRKALPYVKAFFDLISGRANDSAEAKQLIELKNSAVSLGTTLTSVATAVQTAFGIILGVLDQVAAGFNSIFGTNLSGAALGIVLIITKMVGGFTLLVAAIRLAVGVLATFFAGLRLVAASGGLVLAALRAITIVVGLLIGGPALIAAAFIAAAALIIANWDRVREVLAGFGIDVGVVTRALQGFVTFLANTRFGQQLQTDWNDFKRTLSDKGFIEAVKQDLAKLKFEFSLEKAIAQWRADWEALKSVATLAVEGLLKLLKPLLDALDKAFNRSADRSGLGVPQGVPLVGQQPGRFDQLPQSQNIEDRRGEQAPLDQLEQEGRSMIERLAQFASEVGQKISDTFATLVQAAQQAAQGVASAFTGGADLIGTIMSGAFDRIGQSSQQLAERLSGSFRGTIDAMRSSIESIIAQVDAAINSLINRLEQAVQRARELAAAAAGAGGAGPQAANPPGGFALGGYTGNIGRRRIAGVVHGREYVQPANVVARPGVRAFMEMLHRNGGDLGDAIARFARGFATGGFVDEISGRLANSALPALSGLSAAAGRDFGTLVLADASGRAVATVRPDGEASAKSLANYVTVSRIRSMGARPSSVR